MPRQRLNTKRSFKQRRHQSSARAAQPAGHTESVRFCKTRRACFTLISTSRVYSINALSNLNIDELKDSFQASSEQEQPGVSADGISETASTASPVSLTAPQSWRARYWLLNMGKHLIFPFGLIGAEFLLALANLVMRTKEFSRIGYTAGVRKDH